MPTLLEAGLQRAEGRRRPKCVVAREITKLSPELQAEAIELLRNQDIGGTVKQEVFHGIGITVVSQTISYKARMGCACGWCIENEIWPVTGSTDGRSR